MRIVLMSWRDLANPQAGGSELLVDRLLTGLASRGHDVTLVAGGPVGKRDYPVHDAGGTYAQYLRAPYLGMTTFRAADVVIDVANGLPYFSPVWRRGPLVCLMLHSHADQWETRFPKGLANMARLVETRVVPAIYRGRRFVAISSSTAASLRQLGVPESDITVIECGVDLPSPTGPRSQAPLFVALARLVPHKRIDLLIQAWRSVQPVVGGRFVIVGDGPQLATLHRQAEAVPGVEFAGRVSDAERTCLLSEAWLLVNGSHHEGWGLAIMEAAAVGTPSIAVEVPGVQDAVKKGRTGVLVGATTPNLVDEIAKEWIRLAGDTASRSKMGAEAQIWARQNGWDRMVDSWGSVLEDAVNAARNPR